MALELTVPEMACACSEITNAVQALAPTATVEAEPKTKLVSVKTQTSEAAIKQAIADASHTVA